MMKSRRRIGFSIALLACLLFVLAGNYLSDEPEYEGRRLSEWLRELPAPESGFAGRDMAARFAVNFIGTNAIPHLLRSLQARDHGWKAGAAHWLHEKFDMDTLSDLADAERERAIRGFRALGRTAEPAIPALEQLVIGADKEDAYYAVNALQAIGTPQTMPVIFRAITNEDAILREGAQISVGNFRSHAAPAVGLLVKNLAASEKSVRAQAANAIGQIGMEPDIAVPHLIRSLEDSYPLVVRNAILALANYGTNAIGALPKLNKLAMEDEGDFSRVVRFAIVRVQCVQLDGAIVRGPVDRKRIALVFAGHEHGEGMDTILDALNHHNARASFFLTGTFLANPAFTNSVQRILQEGHQIGPHSDAHLLYCSQDTARTNLVTEHEFQQDFFANISRLPDRNVGFRRPSRNFLPPFLHHNRDVADWARSAGWTLVNYTPGTLCHDDDTADLDAGFVSSQAILDGIYKREREDPNGLSGFVLVFHTGSGQGRTDKFHARLPEMLGFLAAKGYEFVSVGDLLRPPRDPNFPGPYGPGYRRR
jgi:peptidoglycan/xylan/chitin deacetylase (PgdA/CDA1 family)